MLADLNTKSHPHSRLVTLRKMWSVERIHLPEAEGKDSDTDPHKMTIKMIRIKPTTAPMMLEEEDEESSKEIKEKGYILGAEGNQSERNFLHTILEIE